jgi:CRP/FNR family cyclic AMP-dependent transcriptional regulator
MRPSIETYADGEVIFRQGQLGDRMFVVLAGAVCIYREDRGMETVLANVGFGETLGELSLFDNHPRSASARAIGATELRVITQDEYSELECDPIIRRMLATLAQRLRTINEAFEEMSVAEAPERERLAQMWEARGWTEE